MAGALAIAGVVPTPNPTLQPTAPQISFGCAKSPERGRQVNFTFGRRRASKVGRLILETARLLLREFDEGDVAAFYVLGSDPAIIRYTRDPGGGFRSVEQAAEILRSHPIADYREYGFGRWACVLREAGAVVGFAGLKRLPELGEVDIGYRFLPAHWGGRAGNRGRSGCSPVRVRSPRAAAGDRAGRAGERGLRAGA